MIIGKTKGDKIKLSKQTYASIWPFFVTVSIGCLFLMLYSTVLANDLTTEKWWMALYTSLPLYLGACVSSFLAVVCNRRSRGWNE